MNKATVFAHSNKGHLPAKLQVSNSGESYWIELYNEGGGNTDQKWHSEVFKRDAIQSMVTALAAHFKSLPPVGTFKCPICGSDSIHTHSGDEIAEHRAYAAPMVADPAGVAVDFREKFKGAYDALKVAAFDSPFWNQSMEQLLSVIDSELNQRAALAATVKAVPSEALDADAILESAAKIADAEMIPTNILSDQWDHGYFAGAGTVAALIRASKSSEIAAPLADKTDGGV